MLHVSPFPIIHPSRLFPLLCAAALLSGLCGCGGLAARGPNAMRIRSTSHYQLVQVDAEDKIPPPPVQPPCTMPKGFDPNARYTHDVTVRDQLEVMITDAAKESPFGRTFSYGPVEVSREGEIMVPYIGVVQVMRRSLPELSEEITGRAQKVSHSAQAAVRRIGRLEKRAYVMGEVHHPGPVTIDRENFNIVDLISSAGGTVKPAHVYAYSFQRRDEICQFSERDMRQRPFLVEDGDVLRVIPDRSRVFHAAGSFNRAGLLDFPSEHPSLLEAISQAGGLNGINSDPHGVFVFREGGEQGPVAYGLDLKDPNSNYLARKFFLKPGDLIYASEAPLSEWSRFVNSIIPSGPGGSSMARLGYSAFMDIPGI